MGDAMNRNCRNCGAPPRPRVDYCTYCGTAVNETPLSGEMPKPRVPMDTMLFTPTPGQVMSV